MLSIKELYKGSIGKTSDKWDLYLDVYDRILHDYRGRIVDLLEIGIQNGGSLEVWGEYFCNAENIIGCDINPECGSLHFDNKSISVIIGDASDQEVASKIFLRSQAFDIVIEDGSHTSRDIIRTFCTYFPAIKPGGIYIAEDLHCSYWHEFGGGLGYPYSGIEFFKTLIDVINANHWKRDQPDPAFYVNEICSAHEISFSSSLVDSISSIEFVDSLCIIKKSQIGQPTRINKRFISGSICAVANVDGPRDLPPGYCVGEQGAYPYSSPTTLLREANLKTAQAEEIRQKLKESESHIAFLERLVGDQNLRITQIYQSTSWKASLPIRLVSKGVKKFGSSVARLVRLFILRAKGSYISELKTKCYTSEPDTPAISDSFLALSGSCERTDTKQDRVQDDSKVIAFYLPQYHRIRENDLWWGPGFTEWTNVVKAQKNFEGHYQPHLPRELGFYDLSNVEVMREQARIAKLYGVSVFCFHYYWFSGRRILQKPVDNFLASDIDLEYCLCWANENWTRTWDGNSKSILLEQEYNKNDPENFIVSLLPHFKDKRYLKKDGMPVLIVYRAQQIPSVKDVFMAWRQIVHSEGYPGLHIIAVDFYDIHRPDEVAADALVEFPPHKFNGNRNIPDIFPETTNSDFSGGIIDYAKVVSQSINRSRPDFVLYRCLFPSWDNTARRQNSPLIVHGSNPDLFGKWLKYIRTYTRDVFADQTNKYIFINAWNEWGEGCHLEPDQEWGLAYLEAVKKSELLISDEVPLDLVRRSIVEAINQRPSTLSGCNGLGFTDFNASDSKPSTIRAGKTIQSIYTRFMSVRFSLRRLVKAAYLRLIEG